jgi:Fe-S metabolism associated domain
VRGQVADAPVAEFTTPALERLVAEFEACADAKARYRLLLEYAANLAPFPETDRTAVNRVMGCTAQASPAAPSAAAEGGVLALTTARQCVMQDKSGNLGTRLASIV